MPSEKSRLYTPENPHRKVAFIRAQKSSVYTRQKSSLYSSTTSIVKFLSSLSATHRQCSSGRLSADNKANSLFLSSAKTIPELTLTTTHVWPCSRTRFLPCFVLPLSFTFVPAFTYNLVIFRW